MEFQFKDSQRQQLLFGPKLLEIFNELMYADLD